MQTDRQINRQIDIQMDGQIDRWPTTTTTTTTTSNSHYPLPTTHYLPATHYPLPTTLHYVQLQLQLQLHFQLNCNYHYRYTTTTTTTTRHLHQLQLQLKLQPQLELELHCNYNYNYDYDYDSQLHSTPHHTTLHVAVVGELTTATTPKAQHQPPFSPSVESLCLPCITTTHLSYSFLSLKLPPRPCAVLLAYTYIIYHISYHFHQSELL